MKNYIANGQAHECINDPSLTNSLQRTADGIQAEPSSVGLLKNVSGAVALNAPTARKLTSTRHIDFSDRL